MRFISIFYFEGMILGFGNAGDVFSYVPGDSGWHHRISGPGSGRSRFTDAVQFEGYILLFSLYGEVWKLEAHADLPSCDWKWELICQDARPGEAY